MTLTPAARQTLLAALAATVFAAGLALWGVQNGGSSAVMLAMVLVGFASAAYLAWYIDPAWLMIAGVLAATFNSNWGVFGLPAGVAPDRFLLLAALGGLILRAPGARDRPTLELRPLHLLFVTTVLWVIGSAIAAQTLTGSNSLFQIVDRFAVPFIIFLVAPLAFRTDRHRRVFLYSFVAYGAYLGLTTLFEAIGLHQLVFPRFILDPTVGAVQHAEGGRARGPFLVASVNGMGLFVCAVAAVITLATDRQRWLRIASAAVLGVCALGVLLTLTRSVWLAASVATFVTLISFRELRRYLLPTAAAIVVMVVASLALVPNFDIEFQQRTEERRSVWERENINAAALEMISQRPLTGFGVDTFNKENAEFFPLLDDVPQVAERRLAIHNIFLLFATELGLIGLALFLLSYLGAMGSALFGPAPSVMRPWRAGLLAIAVFWLVIANFSPFGQTFPTMMPWLWAGVVLGGCRQLGQGIRSAPKDVSSG